VATGLLALVAGMGWAAPSGATAASAPPAARFYRGAHIQITSPARIVASGLIAPLRSPGSPASYPQLIGSFPRQGDVRIPVDVTLWFAFDQPTAKTGAFSLVDLDPASSGGLVSLGVPRWSALGDTVFLRPTAPLAFGHKHSMQVETVRSLDGSFSPGLEVIFFTSGARAKIEPIDPRETARTVYLAAGVTAPVALSVRERNDTFVRFDRASASFLDASGAAIDSVVTPVSVLIPRLGAATLSLRVTLPDAIARRAPLGALRLRLAWYGSDESRLPFAFEATVPLRIGAPLVTDLVVQSVVLEWPQPGAAIAAGDTLLPRAVVTGIGTGHFRGAFILDGEVLAIEEGYIEAGRPAQVRPRGPIPTRRLGEHRLQFTVESPQSIAARPVTFACVPPVAGMTSLAPPVLPSEGIAPPRLSSSVTLLGTARSRLREEDGSGTAWGFGNARYDLGGGAAIEADASLRLRVDDPKAGTARPEQLRVRLSTARGSLEWSDAAPEMAGGAPLFMSAIPRRAARGRVSLPGGGEAQGYFALDSRPASAGGSADEIRSDLYAGRITRSFARSRVEVSAYGGYAHEDPTPGGLETLSRGRAVYGGMGRARLSGDWTLLADAGSVRHRQIVGVEAARTRTAWRSELSGSVAGFRGQAAAFRYQPDLVTGLNPYAISDRRGGAVGVSRTILGRYEIFGGFRSEQPDARSGLVPAVRVDRTRVGTSLSLNQESRVTPTLVWVRHHGANTEYEERRIETEFTAGEQRGGRTTARIDAAEYRDDRAANARHRVYAGSVVSNLRHSARASTTFSFGYEEDVRSDLDKTNRTIQGTFETQWEVLSGRLHVTPWFAASVRDYEARGTKENRLGGRLQIALLRFAGLGENALALTGRLDRLELKLPFRDESTEGAVELAWGQRLDW
jgi:hypothetical protein